MLLTNCLTVRVNSNGKKDMALYLLVKDHWKK